MSKKAIGIASALAGASLWGVSASCMQFLVSGYAISGIFITMVRLAVAAVLFLVVIAVRQRGVIKSAFADARFVGRLVLFGIFGLFTSQITYLVTVGYTNGGTATVIQSTSIVIIMLVTCVAERRAPRPVELAGLVLAFTASLLIATQGDFGTLHLPLAGLLWGFASAIGATLYSTLPQPLYPRWGSLAVVGLGMAIGAVAAALMWGAAFFVPGLDAFMNGGNAIGSALLPALDMPGVTALLAVGVVGTFGAFFLYLNGIAMVGPVRGSQLGAIEPVSATVLSAVFLGTAFSAFDWVGLALMVATIVLVAASK